jgi:hypothetical protein
MPSGIISVFSYFMMAVFGRMTAPRHNPLTDYLSELTADGMPYANITRLFSYTSYVFLIIFALNMSVLSYLKRDKTVCFGFAVLSVAAVVSTVGYGVFPMTVDYPFTFQNLLHVIITIAVIVITLIAIAVITAGYFKRKQFVNLWKISLFSSVLFFILNAAHLFAIFARLNELGLIQRLSVYAFYVYILILSWIYSFNRRSLEKYKRAPKRPL